MIDKLYVYFALVFISFLIGSQKSEKTQIDTVSYPANAVIIGGDKMAEFLQWIGVQFHETFSGNQLIYALIFFVVLDYIAGVCVAVYHRRLSSRIGVSGITKKLFIFAVIALCHILDSYLIHVESALTSVATFFYLSNESISILENIGSLGVPLPKKVTQVLSYLKTSDDSDAKEDKIQWQQK